MTYAKCVSVCSTQGLGLLTSSGVLSYSTAFLGPKNDGGPESNFGSALSELYSEDLQVPDADAQVYRVSNQVLGLVCHDRSKGRILSQYRRT